MLTERSSPAPDVLADLLVMASEAGPERLVATDRLLRDLVGDDLVHEAHLLWTRRLREGLLHGGHDHGQDMASPDAFDLIRALRASKPGRRGGRW